MTNETAVTLPAFADVLLEAFKELEADCVRCTGGDFNLLDPAKVLKQWKKRADKARREYLNLRWDELRIPLTNVGQDIRKPMQEFDRRTKEWVDRICGLTAKPNLSEGRR